MRSWLSLSYGFCFIIVREAFPYVKPDNIYMPLLLSIFFATCQCQHYSTQISSSRLYNLTICSHDYHSFMIFLVWFQVRHLINLGIFACAIAVWQLLLTMFHWWWCYKQVFFPRLWHMRICGHDCHSFSTWTYLHVLLLFGNFCWPCFYDADAETGVFSLTVAYENMKSWLSLFFHLFILIWPALEVGPRHMLWLIRLINWGIWHMVWHNPLHIDCPFLLFLVNWGTLVYAMMTCFSCLQSNLVSRTSLLNGKTSCRPGLMLFYSCVILCSYPAINLVTGTLWCNWSPAFNSLFPFFWRLHTLGDNGKL